MAKRRKRKGRKDNELNIDIDAEIEFSEDDQTTSEDLEDDFFGIPDHMSSIDEIAFDN